MWSTDTSPAALSLGHANENANRSEREICVLSYPFILALSQISTASTILVSIAYPALHGNPSTVASVGPIQILSCGPKFTEITQTRSKLTNGRIADEIGDPACCWRLVSKVSTSSTLPIYQFPSRRLIGGISAGSIAIGVGNHCLEPLHTCVHLNLVRI